MNQSTLILITKPADGESLCRTCYFAHMQSGYRESEESMFCAYGWGPVRPVRFKVRDCTDYLNRTVPTKKEMEDIALIIPTEPKRKIGGFAGMGFATQSEEDDDDLVAMME
jgi:hypothetical protein